jgi:hypothetical protein
VDVFSQAQSIFFKSMILLLAITTFTACSTMSVSNDWDQSVDFSKFETFGVIDNEQPAINTLIDQRIRNAIIAELKSKGLEQMDSYEQADLAIGYEIATEQRRSYQTVHSGWGMSGFRAHNVRLGATMSHSTTQPIDFNIGTLIIAAFKMDDKVLIWEGTASDTVSPASTPEQSTQQINTAVQKILKSFPPGVAQN